MNILFKYTRHGVCTCILLLLISQFVFSQNADMETSTEAVATEQNIEPADAENLVPETELFFNTQEDENVDIPTIGFIDTLRIFLVLIVILAIAIGLVWFLKKFQNTQQNTNSEVIDLISTRTISPGTSLHIIKVARGYILIANSGQNVTLIKEYVEKEDIDEITLSLSQADAESQENNSESFFKKLQKRLSQNNIVFQSILTGNQSQSHSANNNSVLSTFIDKNSIFRKGSK